MVHGRVRRAVRRHRYSGIAEGRAVLHSDAALGLVAPSSRTAVDVGGTDALLHVQPAGQNPKPILQRPGAGRLLY